jgi:cell pole-organizing protein PopZ
VEPTTLGGGPPDVLDLTESMVAPAPPPAAAEVANFRTIDGEPDVIFRETEPEPPRPAQPFAPERTLLSNATTAAVDSAFNTLAHTVLVQNARTLEDLVREMLRPLLKSWLDDNLPGIVERMVKAEIERVSRGRG